MCTPLQQTQHLSFVFVFFYTSVFYFVGQIQQDQIKCEEWASLATHFLDLITPRFV